jgi:hypothetical protein
MYRQCSGALGCSNSALNVELPSHRSRSFLAHIPSQHISGVPSLVSITTPYLSPSCPPPVVPPLCSGRPVSRAQVSCSCVTILSTSWQYRKRRRIKRSVICLGMGVESRPLCTTSPCTTSPAKSYVVAQIAIPHLPRSGDSSLLGSGIESTGYQGKVQSCSRKR